MLTFADFLAATARNGELVNTSFEQDLFRLLSILERISSAFTVAGIPHELIGGLGVLVHVEEAAPEQARLTRDVDLLVRRADLARIKETAANAGFRFRRIAGVDLLTFGETESARNAVHLRFSEEQVRPDDVTATPSIAPESKDLHGATILVAPVADLLRMKLTSFRLKDQVHVQDLLAANLITPAIEQSLPPTLHARLQQVRAAE